ncbi:hypothetical protein FNV43_RR01377 [Rhamnella rubrinervis]|uniref:Leucine-rich repeat-containing N-terminal plant-type domain-containing protein n=1 Tax=Rhamnella rubrinervis TaxID=2594499 RepID=A0A8K0HRC7_9ROSA|nr:hypothetical protein FNV43_RR01377 [Rhamnella rubrinervis]
MKCISFQNLHIVFYLTIFISYRGIYVSCSPNVSTTNSAFKCLPDQTTALLQFKQDFSFQKPNFSYYYYHCSMFSNPYYNDIQPDSYPKMKFWKEEKDCCSWDGVTCDMKTGHVVGLDLSHSWLQGPLRSNSSLFKLHQLQKINLAYNNFTFCHIPSEFGQLSRLTDLILYYSMFSGQIPSEISCLTNLVYLGPLPSSIWNLSNLSIVDLSFNHFNSHELPSTLGNHAKPNLVALWLRSAQFSGEIPSSIGNLTQLKHLDISYNSLSLPKVNTISELPKFQTLYLASCNLSEFPKFLKTQDQLEHLDLSNNRIEDIESAWEQHSWECTDVNKSSMLHLKKLDLSHNQFTREGSTIREIAYARATSSCVAQNKFYGPIWHPPKFWSFERLHIMDLSFNNFSGSLPSEYFTDWVAMIQRPWKCEQLRYVEDKLYPFKHYLNSITVIDKGLEMKSMRILTTFTSIDLSNNRFDGEIPSSIELYGPPLSRICDKEDSPIFHQDNEVESEDGFTWKPVVVGYGFGIVVGFIIGHVTLSQRRSNWFWQSSVGKFIHAAC